jgi:aminoglycoside phosphotransferase (APT) family kinase protein
MAILKDGFGELDALAGRLGAWFAAPSRGLENPEITDFRHASRTNGYSNETFFCSLRTGPADRRTTLDLAIRTPPATAGLFQKYDMNRQFDTMDRLRRGGGFPTPPCRWLESDPAAIGTPFFVMDFVHGLIPPDAPMSYLAGGWLLEASDEQRSLLWWSTVEAIADLGQIDWRAAGLGFMDWPDDGRSRNMHMIDECDQFRRWGNEWLSAGEDPRVEEMGRWLRANEPEEAGAVVVWGDARPGNIVYQDFLPAAVLDWELARTGSPLIDISYFLLSDLWQRSQLGSGTPVPPPGGFPGHDETLRRFSELTSVSTRDFDYYWVLNGYRLLSWVPRFAALHFSQNHMTYEEADRYRTIPALMPYILERME